MAKRHGLLYITASMLHYNDPDDTAFFMRPVTRALMGPESLAALCRFVRVDELDLTPMNLTATKARVVLAAVATHVRRLGTHSVIWDYNRVVGWTQADMDALMATWPADCELCTMDDLKERDRVRDRHSASCRSGSRSA